MKKRTLIVPVLLGGICAAVAALPLGWVAPHVLPENMRQDAQFSGTIWQGQANVPFGKSRAPVSFKAAPLKLITGKSFLDFTVKNSGFYLTGLAGLSQAQDVKINANIAQLPLLDPRIRGLQGKIVAEISEAKLGSGFTGACKTITGQVRTDFLKANEATWFWQGPELSGPIRCEDGTIVAQMAGQEGRQSFTAMLRLMPDGVYTAQMDVTTAEPRAAVVLGFYGFESKGGKFVLSETGRWR